MMNSQPAIVVRDLRVDRGGREVLHGFSAEIPRGRVVGLLGPNGCGKTTLMRSIMGVQIVKSGGVTVLGEPAGSPALRRKVGYSTQSPAVYRDLTVLENLRYFGSVLGVSRADVERVIGEVGLADARGKMVAQLSGGQQSRTSLAVALLNSPEVLVLDEPTVGVDPVLRQDLWEVFHRLAAERGSTLLVSSHVMDEAGRCERLLFMRDGDILADDTPAALRDRTGAGDLEQAFLRLIAERKAA